MTTAAPPSQTLVYQMPDQAQLERKAKNAEDLVSVFLNITNPDEYQMAGEELVSLQTAIKKLEDQRTAITQPQNQALRAVNDLFRAPRERIEAAVAALKQSMLAYNSRVQLEREAARIAAEKRAEAERQQLADEAVLVAEQAKSKVEKIVADADGVLTDEQRAEIQAIEERAQAESQAAELAAAVVTAAPVAQGLPKAFKTAILSRDVVEVTDKALFLRYIVENAADRPELLLLVEFDQKRMDLAAKAFGGTLPWLGVTVHKKQTMRAGSK